MQADTKELVRDNERLQAELELLKTKAASVERLQDENRLLREEIRNLEVANEKSRSKTDSSRSRENTTPTPSLSRSSRTPLAPRSTNEPTPLKKPPKHKRSDIDKLELPELREEYVRLEGSYDKLHEKYLEALNARTELEHRLREKIKNIDQWTTHANKLEAQSKKRLQKVKRLEAQLASVGENPAGSIASFSSDTSDIALTTSERKPQVPSIGRQDSGESTQISTRESSHEKEVPSLPPLPENRDGPQNTVTIKQEPSSDAPVIVSERSVRKRRREDDDVDRAPVRVRVKYEEGSDPMVFEERRNLAPQESMDFDVEVPHVQTPRKNRLRQLQEGDDMDTPEPLRLQYSTARSNLRNNQQVALSRPQTTIPLEPQPAEDTGSVNGREKQRSISNASTLRPLDPNEFPNRTSSGSKAKSRPQLPYPFWLEDGIDRFVEDDDQYQASRASRSLSRTAAPSAAVRAKDLPTSELRDIDLRLPPKRELPFGKDPSRKASENLLRQAKSPAALPTTKRTTTTTATAAVQPKRKPGDGMAISPSPAPTRTSSRANVNNTGGGGDGSSGGGAAAKDKRTPLRDRELTQLRLDDFRVNPATNDGYTYAFTDVVRNQGERATALVGCVRESCCGPQFRALARAERPTEGPVAFRALLESYLGDDLARRQLPRMSDAQKEDLWLEAKTRQLADAHGRCRHRYQRMPSPPGYWRTDFPSTQERDEDRAAGRRMEAEMIQERYREAMRGGGRWLFRDELGA